MSAGKTPEKSSFSRRCSLLSRYLKEKGSFGDIDIGLSRKPDLGLSGKSDLGLSGKSDLGLAGKSDLTGLQNSETKSFEWIPKFHVGEASTSSGGKAKDADVSEPVSEIQEPENSQLTIFFDGKIIVYNEFPQDKAKELMKVAKEANHVAVDSKKTMNHMDLDLNVTSNECNMVMTTTTTTTTLIPDLNEPTSSGNVESHQTGGQQQEHQAIERIARRASLHRFFAKRKDRNVARAPYQVNQNGVHLPPKPKMVVPSIEPGQSSRHPMGPPKPKIQNNMSMEVDEGKKCSKVLELKL